MTTIDKTEDGELRDRLMALKPHSDDQLPLESLLSHAEIESIMAVVTEFATTKAEQLAAERVKDWVEHEAKVLNVENIEHVRNGQYIRVERILAFAATLNKGASNV